MFNEVAAAVTVCSYLVSAAGFPSTMTLNNSTVPIVSVSLGA